MYTSESRQKALDQIILLLKQIPNIEGIVLVGSGANGFPDRWADIDLSVVVFPDEVTHETWKTIHETVKRQFDPIIAGENEYEDQSYLSLVVLPDYLEIDIGVISLSKLVAKKSNWEILFDRDGKVENKMNSSSPPPAKVPDFSERIQSVFYHLRAAVVAIKRNKLLKASKEIEDLRNKIVESWADQHHQIAKHFRDADSFPDEMKTLLRKTYPKSIEVETLYQSILSCIDLFEWCSNNTGADNSHLILECRKMIKEMRNET